MSGDPQYSVYVTGRGGTSTPQDVDLTPSMERVRYGREVNISTLAEVNLPADCCDLVVGVEPWAHELRIVRNNIDVWSGPVWQVGLSEDGSETRVLARDMLAWLQVRAAHALLNYTLVTTENPDGLGRIQDRLFAEKVIVDALSPEDSMGLLKYLQIMDPCGDEVLTDRKLDPTEGDMSWTDGLQPMLGSSLDITAFGRRIIVGCVGQQFGGTTATVITNQDLIGKWNLSRRGDIWGSRWIATGKEGADANSTVVTVGSAGGTSPRYGLVERKATVSTVGTDDGADAVAAAKLAEFDSYPPWQLNGVDQTGIDPGELHPDTDWDWARVPAGGGVGIAVESCGAKVAFQARLDKLEVDVRPTGEAVTASFTTAKV